jgi:hypothetical protein
MEWKLVLRQHGVPHLFFGCVLPLVVLAVTHHFYSTTVKTMPTQTFSNLFSWVDQLSVIMHERNPLCTNMGNKRWTAKKSTLMNVFDSTKKAILPFAMVAALATSPDESMAQMWPRVLSTYPAQNATNGINQTTEMDRITMQEVFCQSDPRLSKVGADKLDIYRKIYANLVNNLHYDLEIGDKINRRFTRILTPSDNKKNSIGILKNTGIGDCAQFADYITIELDKLKINNWIMVLGHRNPNASIGVEFEHALNLLEINNQLLVSDLTPNVIAKDSGKKFGPRLLTLNEYLKKSTSTTTNHNTDTVLITRFDEKTMEAHYIPYERFILLHQKLKNNEQFRADFAEYNRMHPRRGYEREIAEQKPVIKQKAKPKEFNVFDMLNPDVLLNDLSDTMQQVQQKKVTFAGLKENNVSRLLNPNELLNDLVAETAKQIGNPKEQTIQQVVHQEEK